MFTALLLPSAHAQSNPNIDNGIKPFGSYDATKIDTVDIATGALSLHIPLLSYSQRGSLPPVNYSINFASKAFVINPHCVTQANEPICSPHWEASVRPSGVNTPSFGVYVLRDDGSPELYYSKLQTSTPTYYQFSIVSSDEKKHMLFANPFGSGLLTEDGTGYGCIGCNATSPTSTATMYTRNGSFDNTASNSFEDIHGNTEVNSPSTSVDSLGRSYSSALSPTDYTGCSGDRQITSAGISTLPGVNGGSTYIKTCMATLSVNTTFNDSSYYDPAGNTSGNWPSGSYVTEAGGPYPVVQTVLQYDGNSWATSPAWTFQYNDGYGDLAQITLPTGGTIKYTWATIAPCNAGYPGVTNMSRAVISRTLDAKDGSPAIVTTYSGSVVNDGTNDTVYTFTGLGGSCSLYETQVQYYSGSMSGGKPLKTVQTGYTFSYDPNASSYGDSANHVMAVFPTSVITTLPSGRMSKVETDYQTSTSDGVVMSTGNVLQKREYDWGNGSPGSLIRCTATVYKDQLSSAYFGANLLDIPASVSVYSGGCGNGTLIAKTTYGYDETTLQGSGVSVQRDASASGNTIRGNLTSTQKWLNTTGGNLTDYFTYYDTGEKYRHTDARNNTSTFYYDNQYAGGYLTSTQMPSTGSVAHTVSAGYDFNTGLITSYTDQNGKSSVYGYDTLLRMTGATYPDLGYVQLSYPTFTAVQKTVGLNSTSAATSTSTFDGLGRSVGTILSEGGGVYTYTRTAYDAQNRRFQVWNPSHCDPGTATSCSGEATWGYTTFLYDGLGRTVQQTNPDNTSRQWCYNSFNSNGQANCQAEIAGIGETVDEADESRNDWQRTTDALGRLTYVAEPDGTNPTPSMVTGYAYDASNNLTSVNQSGGGSGSTGARSRLFVYDSLSRLTNSTNSESGTISYTYDANGNVTQKTVPAPNSTTAGATATLGYSYDALDRLCYKFYGAPTANCPSSTPTNAVAAFTYDTSSYSGTANAIGRVTSETTLSNGSIISQKTALAYDAMGHLIYEQQCPLGNCSTPYTLQYSYDLAGNLTSSTNGLSGTNAKSFGYSYDNAGRLCLVTDAGKPVNNSCVLLSSGTNLFSVTSYGTGGIIGAQFGATTSSAAISMVRGYDNRMRLLSETDYSGLVPADPANDATAYINIGGTEQALTQTIAAVAATGTVAISGAERKMRPSDCPTNSNTCYIYDTGTVWITVNGVKASSAYGQGATVATIVTNLTNAINAINTYPVQATASGMSVILTAKATGAASDYTLSAGRTYDTSDFSVASFSTSVSGATLTGGVDASSHTTYDSGTISITVNGTAYSAGYGQGSTPNSLASQLVSEINGDPAAPVTASSIDAQVWLASKSGGAIGDYGFSSAVSYDTANFSRSSFTVSNTSSSLNGGENAQSGGSSTGSVLYGFNIPQAGGYTPNGNLSTYTDSVLGTWNFGYDTLNRLTSGNATIGAYAGENGCWTYDPFGNRTLEAFSTLTTTPCAFGANDNSQSIPAVFTQSNNHADGLNYDVAGNVLNDGQNTYAYDNEGRLCAVAANLTGQTLYTQYVYDAEGQRVAKGSATSLSCAAPTSANGFTASNQYLLNLGGAQVTELNGTGTALHTNAWAGGKLLATYDFANSGLHYALTDWLGTKRVQVSGSGSTLGAAELNCYNLPFGNNLGDVRISDCRAVGSGAADATEHHFTGKERDAETGNDYFGARYYASSMGRFMSPDWSAKVEPVPYAKLDNPQSLNLYAYVENNPLSRSDLDGHYWCDKAPGSLACQNENAWDSQHGILTDGSKNAIANSALSGQQQKDFTNAVEKSAGSANIDPNILVGMAQKESTLGANMNPDGAAKGLYGIEDGQMNQMNKMFKLNMTTADLLSLSAGSMMKVSTGAADYLGHYADIFSSRTDPRGIDIAIGVWRVGIGNARTALKSDGFWDYVAPNDRYKEKLSTYIDAVERYDH
jgi:RHS repeat-associated protein